MKLEHDLLDQESLESLKIASKEELNVKEEPSVEYLLITPPVIEPEVFLKQMKLEHDLPEKEVLNIASEEKEINVKQEPSVEYVLIIPPEASVTQFPLPMKQENENVTDLDDNITDSEDNDTCKQCEEMLMCEKHKHVSDIKSKSFKCHYCAKKFACHGGLIQHIAIHLKSEKKACKICGTVLVKSRLAQHMESVHGKPKFRCDLCPAVKSCRNKISSYAVSSETLRM
jgi:hypothetical protein